MNLENKVQFEEIIKNKSDYKRIFFYRICGTGMGAAACLLKEKGYEVEGADNNFYPPMSTYLESTGIPLKKLSDINIEFLKTFDLIVVGNVVPRNSDDATFIEEIGVAFTSFPAALGALVLNDVNVVGIAGTHGKTTTTYFMTQVFEKLGMNPGYFIGGVMDFRPSSRLGDGKYFFIESDEYDSAYFEKISKFRLYTLNNLILTSLEFDHADIFNDIEDIKDEFRASIPDVSKTYIINEDYEAACDLVKEFKAKNANKNWIKYGSSITEGPHIIEENSRTTSFELVIDGNKEVFNTNLIGKHNILNLTTVILFAYSEGIPLEKIRGTINELEHVKRRQEVRGVYKGSVVVDDFAHHPRAVELTVDSVQTQYPEKEIVVIMEPNSATARSSIFQDEFANSLLKVKKVIFAKPIRPTSVKNTTDLDGTKIVSDLCRSGVEAIVVENLEELMNEIDENVGIDKLLLVLSNGTCLGLWESNFVKELK